MEEVGGLAFIALLAAALLGPLATLFLGRRAFAPSMVALFASAILAMPFAALTSEPADFRGAAVIMAALLFAFGLVMMAIAGTIRAR